MRWLNQYRLLSVLILAAVMFYSYAHYLGLNAGGVALTQTISLDQTGNYEFEFVAGQDSNYELLLEVVRDWKSSTQPCLLGLPSPECAETEEKLNIAWSVVTQGKMLHAGQSLGGKRLVVGETLNKVLVDFNADKDAVYQISAQVSEPDKRLNEGNIVIALNVLLRKEAASKQFFYTVIAAVILLLVVLLCLYNYYKTKSADTKNNDAGQPLV